MIIARAPLRITLGGGGTDIPAYYREHGGFCLTATINKYVYVAVHNTFSEGLILKYSEIERPGVPEAIKHPIIREAFKLIKPPERIEVVSFADIPAGMGLGSSSSFTCALLTALSARVGRAITPAALADEACKVEIDMVGSPIGKQDQYACAFGGFQAFAFGNDGAVTQPVLTISATTALSLERDLCLFSTGIERSASRVIKAQPHDAAFFASLHEVKEIAFEVVAALESGDLAQFAKLLTAQWEAKKRRSGTTNDRLNHLFNVAMNSGALGGKLIGAGGGGFLLFYADDHDRLSERMTAQGLREVRFKFDWKGTQLLNV